MEIRANNALWINRGNGQQLTRYAARFQVPPLAPGYATADHRWIYCWYILAGTVAPLEVAVAKTLIDVDEDLLRRARQILGSEATKKDAVNAGLSMLVRLHDQRETIDWITNTDPIADLRDQKVRDAARR